MNSICLQKFASKISWFFSNLFHKPFGIENRSANFNDIIFRGILMLSRKILRECTLLLLDCENIMCLVHNCKLERIWRTSHTLNYYLELLNTYSLKCLISIFLTFKEILANFLIPDLFLKFPTFKEFPDL